MKKTETRVSLPTLYKRTALEQIQVWTMNVDGNKFFSIEGIQGGTMTTNKPTVCAGKNIGRANETSPEDQATKEAQAKWKKKTESGYTEDIDEVDTALKFFKPMLCESYDDYKDDVLAVFAAGGSVYAQPKLDGMRCIGQKTGLWSRNGKPIVSVPHIMTAIKPLVDKGVVFDGELYCDKLKNDFNEIMHHVRQAKPKAEDLEASKAAIQYWIYDLPSCEKPFGERNKALGDLATVNFNQDSPIVIVETVKVSSEKELTALYEKWVAAGMEGQIIRFDAPYESKRTKKILKRKEFKTEEYPIVDICEGVGNRAGTAGYMVLRLPDERTFKSNIKGPYTLLTKIWNNRKNYIGKSATCKYFNLTPDGIPRFGYVIDVAREDFE